MMYFYTIKKKKHKTYGRHTFQVGSSQLVGFVLLFEGWGCKQVKRGF